MKTDKIALVMDIPVLQVERIYYRELQTGALMANQSVAATVLDVATDRTHKKCIEAATFWLRSQAGWRDVRKVETSTTDIPEEQKAKLINTILERLTNPLGTAKEPAVK